MVLEAYVGDCTLSVRCHEDTAQFNMKFVLVLANAKQHSKTSVIVAFVWMQYVKLRAQSS